jgi:uncharacterized protein (TIGR02996 family)
MNPHQPFLNAITADIESDLPRLQYADFLDETGDPLFAARAEFIRVQCALETLRPENPQYFEMAKRERELLVSHWREWFRPVREAAGEPEFLPRNPFRFWRKSEDRFRLMNVPGLSDPMNRVRRVFMIPTAISNYVYFATFERGFIDHLFFGISGDHRRRPIPFPAILASTPLRRATFSGAAESLAEMMQANTHGQLRSLELMPTSAQEIELLVESPGASGFRELIYRSLGYGLSEGQLFNPTPRLVESRRMTGLRILQLDVDLSIESCLDPLFGSPLLKQLEVLRIDHPEVDVSFLNRLVLDPEMAPNLKELHVQTRDTILGRLWETIRSRFGSKFTIKVPSDEEE